MKKKHFNIPVFIPEAACPFQCIYCNQRKISGRPHIPNDEEINRIITDHLATIEAGISEVELAFFGGNFTGFPLEEQRHYLEIAQPFVEKKLISGIRLSTRPDYISSEILDLLRKYHVKTIELGAQSFDALVLKNAHRGHTASDTEKAASMILQAGFNLGLQMMIGLPNDTLEKAIFTAKKIIKLGASETRIYPTLVIKDTILEKHFNEGKYKPLDLDEAVRWSARLLKIFENSDVKVLKLGLHPSKGLLSGEDMVAGPWHPSFRELVLTEIWREQLESLLKFNEDAIEIIVPPDELNYAVGYGKANKKFLQRKFKSVKFTTNTKLRIHQFKVNPETII